MILSYEDYLYNKEKLESSLELVRKYKEGEELKELEKIAKDKLNNWKKDLQKWISEIKNDKFDELIAGHPEIKEEIDFDYVIQERKRIERYVELEEAIEFIKEDPSKKKSYLW